MTKPRLINSVFIQALAAIILIGALGLQLLGSIQQASPTIDEPHHLARGLAFWSEKDTRLSHAHPPLANAFATAGLSSDYEFSSHQFWWKQANVQKFVTDLVNEDYEGFEHSLKKARLSILWLCVLLALYLFVRVRQLFGPWVAMTTLFLFCFSPTLMAHAGLVTTDFAITFLATIFIIEWTQYLRKATSWRLLLCGVLLGLACATKYSAIGLVIFAFFSLAYCMFTRQGLCKDMTFSEFSWLIARHLLILGAVSILLVNASYRFQETGLTKTEIFKHEEPRSYVTAPYEGEMMEQLSPIRHLPEWLPIPLPFTYLYGLTSIRAQNQSDHSSWFMGHPTDGGVWSFFPTLFVVKNSLAIPVLLVFGALMMLQHRRRLTSLTLTTQTLLLFIGFFLGMASSSNLNIGVRHILPIFPVAILCAALASRKFVMNSSWSSRFLLLVLAVETTVAAVLIYPHHLGFFNLLAGGPANGSRVSIVGEDWGQDSGATARYFSDNDVPRPFVVTYGDTTLPEFRKMGLTPRPVKCRTQPPQGAWISIPRTVEWRAGKNCYPWLARADKVAVINHHVTIYRITAGKKN